MRWILPGGAVLGERNRRDNERAVACRPRAAVLESMRPKTFRERLRCKVKGLLSAGKRGLGSVTTFVCRLWSKEWLPTVERVLKVLTLLVGLITAILALFGLSRK
jgi:hypothetical protein